MDTTFLIFLIGSAAAYLPIYWLLKNGVSRFGQRAERRPHDDNRSSRSSFLHCLKGEVASRAVVALRLAVGDMRRAALRNGDEGAVPSAEQMNRLQDLRRLMEPLCSRAEMASFDQIRLLLAAGDRRQVDTISARVDEFATLLRTSQPDSPQPERVRNSGWLATFMAWSTRSPAPARLAASG